MLNVITVVLLVGPAIDRRHILLNAYKMGMCNGDYVFYTMSLLPEHDTPSKVAPWKLVGDDRDEDAKAAYEAVFHVNIHTFILFILTANNFTALYMGLSVGLSVHLSTV